jgi:hypothetical protein
MKNNIERELVNYLYYELNTLGILLNHEIFEYDVQSSIHKYLKFKRYPNEKIEREKERKSDVVIKRYLENSKEIDLMEVKTYIKKNEKLSYVNIFNDIEKLTQTLEFYGEEFNEKKGYFLLAFREKVLNVNYKSFRNKAFSEFLKDDSSKIYNFEAEGKKFKTRIIRSVKTAFLSEKNEFSAHKNQIRIIMFELIK